MQIERISLAELQSYPIANAKMTLQLDATILVDALQGLELQKPRIDAQITDVRARLGRPNSAKPGSAVKAVTRKPRTMSPASRKRIADAQRKRRAAYHKEKAAE